jgi:hypothetical protein
MNGLIIKIKLALNLVLLTINIWLDCLKLKEISFFSIKFLKLLLRKSMK